jgi:hypothetical protein
VENLHIEVIVVVGHGEERIANLNDFLKDIIFCVLAESIYITTHLGVVEHLFVHFKNTLMVELTIGLFILEYLVEILFKLLYGHTKRVVREATYCVDKAKYI